MSRVLITGGAGFVGSHLCDLLLREGFEVRVLDSLHPQIHGEAPELPACAPGATFLRGDVRDPQAVEEALAGVEMVVHLAAAVGVGQSMYEIADYVSTNELGTAVLLQAMQGRPISRFVLASSMSIYGEGAARGIDGSVTARTVRDPDRLARGDWEPQDATGAPTRPLPTSEDHVPNLASIYAINKFAQERLCLVFGRAYRVPTVALRFFNIYGPGQALSNPYTGVLAIFASRLLNGRPPMIFEDGRQLRDFVHVRDVARACLAALREPAADGLAINVGTGEPRTVIEVAEELGRAVERPDLRPQITGRYRLGDIRHCYADTRLAREALGFAAREDFAAGLAELAAWLRTQVAVDRVEAATDELSRRGLVA